SAAHAPPDRTEKRTPSRRSAYTGTPPGVTPTSITPGRDSRGTSGSEAHALDSAGRYRTAMDAGRGPKMSSDATIDRTASPRPFRYRSSATGIGTEPAARSVVGGDQA